MVPWFVKAFMPLFQMDIQMVEAFVFVLDLQNQQPDMESSLATEFHFRVFEPLKVERHAKLFPGGHFSRDTLNMSGPHGSRPPNV